MLASQYLKVDLVSKDVFDCLLECDSNFSINIIRLKQTTIPEFANSYNKINSYFEEIALLLDNADGFDDPFFKAAVKKFQFNEVNEINLGLAKGKIGNGYKGQVARNTIIDAYKIVKKGVKNPRLFHLASLFEDRVGSDRISDMIATLIKEDIVQYSKRIYRELGINSNTRPELPFIDGVAINKYKNIPLLLLPEDILQDIPIAHDWDDIDTVVSKNNAIKAEMSQEVLETWHKWATSDKKTYILNNVLCVPDKAERILKEYDNTRVARVNISSNVEYVVNKVISAISNNLNIKINGQVDTLTASRNIISIFKHWVEDEKGWDLIQDLDSRKREKHVQSIIKACSDYYADVNNLRVSPETNVGNGPVDFTVSRGNDCTVIEVKLSSNSQYLHGYLVQIEKYAESEKTDNKLYVYVDVGNPDKTKKLKEIYEQDLINGSHHAEVIIIDATRRLSASRA